MRGFSKLYNNLARHKYMTSHMGSDHNSKNSLLMTRFGVTNDSPNAFYKSDLCCSRFLSLYVHKDAVSAELFENLFDNLTALLK